MDYTKISKYIELVFIILILPTLFGAILKSIALIHVPIRSELFNALFMQQNAGFIIYIILLLNMMFAIASVLLLFIGFGLSFKLNDKANQISSWAKYFLTIVSLSNLIVIFFISKMQENLVLLEQTQKSWQLTLILAVIFILIKLFRNKFYK